MLRILILLVALSSGGLAAWLALGPAEEAPAATASEPVQVALEDVLVANVELKRGASLDETTMGWQPWPKDAVPAGFISRSARPDALQTLKGSVVRTGFVAGEPIRDDKLAPAGSGFLSGLLPPGKRAVAVRITAESTAGGFILPDDRVDVIHTAAKPASENQQPQVFSRTILSNVRVLAVDQTAAESADGAAVVGKTATLEVDPDQVTMIAAAETSGSIALALRAASDNDEPSAAVDVKESSGTVRVIGSGRATLIEVRRSGVDGKPLRTKSPSQAAKADGTTKDLL